MMPDPVVIVGAARTPMGAFLGRLADRSAPELGAAAIAGALADGGVAGQAVDEVVMGCVLTAGMGQAPARQAALRAGLPESVACTTINKVCGSGMKAVMIARDMLLVGSARVVVAGGMESMSRAPHLLARARKGIRSGDCRLDDHMLRDGLTDAYGAPGRHMAEFAEDAAAAHQIGRDRQDRFALESFRRARAAVADIVPVGDLDRDEPPFLPDLARLPGLKPAFRDGGTITSGNASTNADGAAALVLTRRSEAERLGLKVRAVLKAQAGHALPPPQYPVAPAGAVRAVLERAGWRRGQLDLVEINEAFALVPLLAMGELGLAHDLVNVRGGACALGHPIGASGARIVVTLLTAMRERHARRGVATICIGGGEATALALEAA